MCQSYAFGKCIQVTLSYGNRCYIKTKNSTLRVINKDTWCSSSTPLTNPLDLQEWNDLYCYNVV
eukprot:Pgem_evm1s13806